MKESTLKFAIAIMLLLSNIFVGFAQDKHLATDVFYKIRQAEMQTSQIPHIAHYLTDVSGPRLTNSPGFARAAAWAIKSFKSYGLTNTKLEPWGNFGKSWELQDFSIAMKAPYFQPIVALPAPWSGNTNGPIQAQVTLLTQAQAIDSAYIKNHYNDLRGMIILILGQPLFTSGPEKASDIFAPRATRFTEDELSKTDDYYNYTYDQIHALNDQLRLEEKLNLLYEKAGAVAVIHSEAGNTYGTVFDESFHSYQSKSKVPQVKMAYEDCQRIQRLITSGHPVELALNIKGSYFGNDTKAYNVIGEIPGSDPQLKDQVVILGAHLDSWSASTGATDNASGCAVMMEAVRLLDSLHLQPKRTIRIVLWSGEEQGIYGSYNYVKNHYINPSTGKPNSEQEKVSAYFNLDNGTGKIRGIYTQGNTAVKPLFDQWFQPFHDLGATTVANKYTGCTDHTSFDWAGIPGFEFIQDPIDYDNITHHSNQDNYDHLQIEDLKQAAIIVASFVYQAGNRPDLLPRKPFEKRLFEWDNLAL
ncbi:M20/M25/M40 family metallo-hydrolase [Mucilaginibacter sp. SMC90]|uniref:M20/M25/M40 family metallo-hydrolase n=1 Tax=Mucilaginibacter sp. SMC90 TaxID=2929803 RepID=UPI001FB4D755|nr:M20/M25/M40 family metallo-hydrolase [Mucilaginibacter sp. SMC90]UOE50632.1 M20/M25/M40 family metallo-hydrolase [Mucilaginibacter sp. SMC90]